MEVIGKLLVCLVEFVFDVFGCLVVCLVVVGDNFVIDGVFVVLIGFIFVFVIV